MIGTRKLEQKFSLVAKYNDKYYATIEKNNKEIFEFDLISRGSNVCFFDTLPNAAEIIDIVAITRFSLHAGNSKRKKGIIQ